MDARLPVRAFFTDRHGGVSAGPYESLNVATHVGDTAAAVSINRGVVQDRAGTPVIFMRPDHGIAVARLDESYLDGREPPVADVLTTTVRGLGLATLAADCVPLLAHDASSGAVAAAHIGREGLRKGVVDAAVAAIIDIRQTRSHPDSVTFSIGPCICGTCYEVSSQVASTVSRSHPTALATTSWGTPSLDLPRAVVGRLAELGFTRVFRHRFCTFEELRLFSYRREGTTGRQAGVIVCEGPPS
ncbi:polyphenol oxidase family protein [Demequina sp.]|uniref:polyphenol oxidase family protein n=1 Tax=Demequina sp. TaxID=2050685 RepID=UPI0025B9188C|nr:polyphenol oxidase family protein [Demequina sp.]